MNEVTITKIAKLAGKSEATVSLVLNSGQYHRVSEATRLKIQKVADELGYIPNIRAQALANKCTRNIALVVIVMTPFYNEYVRSITHKLEEYNYNTFAFETMLNPDREKKIINWVQQGLFDGVICLEYNKNNQMLYSPVIDKKLPYVLRGWDILGENTPLNMIRVDYNTPIEQLFKHLAEKNRQNLGVLLDTSSYYKDADKKIIRKSIYQQLAAKYNLKINDDNAEAIPIDIENHMACVYEKTLEMLTKNPEIDSLILQSSVDLIAVYKAANTLKRKIGEDLSIATFDAIPMLDFMTPEATCISESHAEISTLITDSLLAQLKIKDIKSPNLYNAIKAQLYIK